MPRGPPSQSSPVQPSSLAIAYASGWLVENVICRADKTQIVPDYHDWTSSRIV